MSRNFHNLHVHARTDAQRQQVIKAVLAYAMKAGFERVSRPARADRVIRLGGKAPWISVEDDAYEATQIAEAVARATKLPVLEAYCEASAIVWLGLYAGGKRAGGWARDGKRGPAKKWLEPLLAKGTPAELAKAFADGLIQTFPESALAVAAERFGMSVEQMFGEAVLRSGTTLALRRKRATWTPVCKTGTPAFQVSFGSNSAWGPHHLVFEGQIEPHRVHVSSSGGPGRGLSIRFSGTALAGGHIELLKCRHNDLKLVSDGPNAWRDDKAEIPAGLAEQPDTFAMGRREADRARAIVDKTGWYIDIEYRCLKQGACQLRAEVQSGDATASGALDLMVMWKPWRPSVALPHVSEFSLFTMHRTEHATAHIALRGSIAEAWKWARPHIDAWTAQSKDGIVRIERDHQVLKMGERTAMDFDEVPQLAPQASTIPFQVMGDSYLLGTFGYPPWQMDPREQLVVELVLSANNPREDNAPLLARLEAICNDAIAKGVAYSAVVEQNQYRPSDKTRWEEITVREDAPLKLAAWHETHIRGIDKRIWMSVKHAARLDRAALPDFVAVTDLGLGIRLQVPDDRMRQELEPVLAALGALVPTNAEAERWTEARKAELGLLPPPAPAAPAADDSAPSSA